VERTADRTGGPLPAGTDAVTVWRGDAASAVFDDPAFCAAWEALGRRCAWREASLGDPVGTSFLRAWLAGHAAVARVVAAARAPRGELVAGLVLTGTADGRYLVLPGDVFRLTDGWSAGPEATPEVLGALLARLAEPDLPPRLVLRCLPEPAAGLWRAAAGATRGPEIVVRPAADAPAVAAPRVAASAAASVAAPGDGAVSRDESVEPALAALPALCDFAEGAAGRPEPFRDDPALGATIRAWRAHAPEVAAGTVTQGGAVAAAYLALGTGGGARTLLAGAASRGRRRRARRPAAPAGRGGTRRPRRRAPAHGTRARRVGA
jgi:hypothetical protein